MSVQSHAEPFFSPGRPDRPQGRTGVLLSHGFTGSPASMVPWGRHLAEQGYAVAVPRLPGHGTSWQDMATTGWEDWSTELERSFEKLAAEADRVFVGGLSMGGGLALWLAARHPERVAGVILVNAAVASANKQLLAVPVLKHVVKAMPGIGNDIKKPGVDEYGYDKTPLKPLHSMMRGWKGLRGDLGKVQCPLLVFRSSEDHVVDPSSARIILSSTSSSDAVERVLDNSYHVATLDHDAPTIFAESVEFIERVSAAD
jgi:carboxylesterase